MLEGMTSQRGVIGFDIKFEILVQAVIPQETNHRSCIKVILVLGRFLWLGFNRNPL